MNRWITHEYIPNLSDSLYKPRIDVSFIAEHMGFRPIDFELKFENQSDDFIKGKIEGIIAGVSKDDMIVFQYPTNNGWGFDWVFVDALKKRGAKVALLLHDLKSLWGWSCPYPELQFFNEEADLLIVHSEPMKDYLLAHEMKPEIIVREFHDIMLNEMDAPLSDKLEKKLVFVGAANKSPFLKDWDFETELWASYIKADFEVSDKVINGGEHLFDELVRVIPKDRFGILWDTDFPSEGEGGAFASKKFREYTRYNAPHKIALYLALGMPVIVWEESATAILVKKYGLGYTISSLDEIDPLLSGLSDEELYALKQRVNNFSNLLRSGYFTRRALMDVETYFLHGEAIKQR